MSRWLDGTAWGVPRAGNEPSGRPGVVSSATSGPNCCRFANRRLCSGGARRHLAGVDVTTAAASTIVDVTLELFGQLAHTALGLSSLMYLGLGRRNRPPRIGLAVGALLAAGSRPRRGFDLFDRSAGCSAAAGPIRRRPARQPSRPRSPPSTGAGRVVSSSTLHLACWIRVRSKPGRVAFCCASLCLRYGTGDRESALRGTEHRFAVPTRSGSRRSLFCSRHFGLAPETALALSLLKRARDMTIGVPASFVAAPESGGCGVEPATAHPAAENRSPGRDDRVSPRQLAVVTGQ